MKIRQFQEGRKMESPEGATASGVVMIIYTDYSREVDLHTQNTMHMHVQSVTHMPLQIS